MRLTITIDCDNDAFHPTPRREVARLLTLLSSRITHREIDLSNNDAKAAKLIDLNGNAVGFVAVSECES